MDTIRRSYKRRCPTTISNLAAPLWGATRSPSSLRLIRHRRAPYERLSREGGNTDAASAACSFRPEPGQVAAALAEERRTRRSRSSRFRDVATQAREFLQDHIRGCKRRLGGRGHRAKNCDKRLPVDRRPFRGSLWYSRGRGTLPVGSRRFG